MISFIFVRVSLMLTLNDLCVVVFPLSLTLSLIVPPEFLRSHPKIVQFVV